MSGVVLELDINAELEDLLADEWAVQLDGSAVDPTPQRITPPACHHVLHWIVSWRWTVSAIHVLRNGERLKTFTFPHDIRMQPRDELVVDLTLKVA